ncbi:MAG: hypothetical protein IT436_09240 [Phycisphaerales bacterium]|nr:hypothetical protein [Phycisphaerales bacterium]
MHSLHILVVLLSISSMSARTTAQDMVTDGRPAPRAGPAEAAEPMVAFACMIQGEWKMTAESGTSMFRTWHWGPGRHSMRIMTDGFDAAGNPWREMEVVYWQPDRKQVCLLGMSPFRRGISEGTVKFEGDSARFDIDLYQTGGRRTLRSLWTFDGPDKYHAALLEANTPAGPDFAPLAEWDFFRTPPPTPTRLFSVEGATEPSELLKPLKSLLGMWLAKTNAATAGPFNTRATLEWIPLADAIYARVLTPSADGEPTHLLDAYLYHHTGVGALRCLALSSRGVVYEGEITVLEGGALHAELKGYEGNRVVVLVARINFERDGTLRQQVWSTDGADRTLLLDVHHEPIHPANGQPP